MLIQCSSLYEALLAVINPPVQSLFQWAPDCCFKGTLKPVAEEVHHPFTLVLSAWSLWGTRSHTKSLSICLTQVTSSHFPWSHTFPHMHQTPSHVGFHAVYPHAAGTHWHVCPGASLFDLSHTHSQNFFYEETCADWMLTNEYEDDVGMQWF